MKPTVYIETSVISYLASKPRRDLIATANQQVTLEWWQSCYPKYDPYISQIVVQESEAGDQEAAEKRLRVIRSLPLLELSQNVYALAHVLLEDGPLPEKASRDAIHIAVATVHGMDYLLTWNYKHIANASMRNAIIRICHAQGYEIPVICTPQELIGE